MKKVELSSESTKKLVLIYVGARFKGIDIDRSQIANMLICSATKNVIPTFFTPSGECFTASELIDYANKTIFSVLQEYFYCGNTLSSNAVRFFQESHYNEQQVEAKLLIHALKTQLDFQYLHDVDVHAVSKALLSNEELVSQGILAIKKPCFIDIDSAHQCHKLIKMVIRDYRHGRHQ